MDILGPLLTPLLTFIGSNLWWILPLVVFRIVFTFPMPGRGPRSSRRDPWRGFKYAAREEVMYRADGRCEAAVALAWGRCGRAATEVDHVFPHAKGGPTVVSNSQALCQYHNRRKGSRMPPWWYIRALEKRRLNYFPEDDDVRVFAVMSHDEVERRRQWAAKRRGI